MTGADKPLLCAACVLGVAAIASLRYAWSLPQRSPGWNGAGWSTLVASALCGWWSDGAWGVSVAAKTPQPVVDRLSAEILKAMDSPDMKERLRNMGSEPPAIRTPDQFAAFVAAELKTYTELVRRSGAKVD